MYKTFPLHLICKLGKEKLHEKNAAAVLIRGNGTDQITLL